MISRLILLTLLTLHPNIWMIYIFNINNIHFDNMVSQIYPAELQLNLVNTHDTEASLKTCICTFLMLLFRPKFMINVTVLILKLSISFFRW